ncbi:hypothetical protein ACC719_35735, partial [Rhizobium ruizarguesonis]
MFKDKQEGVVDEGCGHVGVERGGMGGGGGGVAWGGGGGGVRFDTCKGKVSGVGGVTGKGRLWRVGEFRAGGME